MTFLLKFAESVTSFRVEYLLDGPYVCPVDVPILDALSICLDPTALLKVLNDDLLVQVGLPLELSARHHLLN